MRVLVAFDKFKGALNAVELCELTSRTLRGIHPDWKIDLCPLTDGGDGFDAVLATALQAQPAGVQVTGPRGGLIHAGLSLARWDALPARARSLLELPVPPRNSANVAIVELARASGLARLPAELRDPFATTTYGTGQLLRAAAEAGAEVIVLGVGGSATNDLGFGALSALGLEFRGAEGEKFRPPFPRCWPQIVRLEGDVYPSIPPIFIACDVDNPLFGPQGAAAVFGPQKGLSPDGVARIEREAQRLARLLCEHTGQPYSLTQTPGAGAAGGIAFGLLCAARAKLIPGFEFVSASLDLDARIAAADIVISGEGRLDASTWNGKGPGCLLIRAASAGKRAHAVVGQAIGSAPDGIKVHALSPAGPVTPELLSQTASRLVSTVQAAFV